MLNCELRDIFSEQSVAALLAWYGEEKRDLPWRHTRDPYRIWISEIMLQQTRVEAVKPYYTRFLQAAPDVAALAALPEDALMKLWEGLGYYSRARNLQKAARAVMGTCGGRMPTDYAALLALPGIGEYTAGAIASIAYGARVPAVDGNVLRVLARLTACRADIARQETKNAFRTALARVVPADAGSFTQAMIELGATVCAPNRAPRCEACPMRAVCRARREGSTQCLPVKGAKKARRIEERTVLLICDGRHTVLRKRPRGGLLSGLYELPNTEGHADAAAVTDHLRSLGLEPLRIEPIEASKHIFTHIEWHMIAYRVVITAEFDGFPEGSGLQLVPNDALHAHYAIPSAFSAYTKYL